MGVQVSRSVILSVLWCLIATVSAACAQEPSAESRSTDVAHLARSYRRQVYDAFRTDRAEFDRRWSAWSEVEAAWRAAGARDDDIPQLTAWLRAATLASMAQTAAPLPGAPQFENAHATTPAPLPETQLPETLPPATLAPEPPSSEPPAPEPMVEETPAIDSPSATDVAPSVDAVPDDASPNVKTPADASPPPPSADVDPPAPTTSDDVGTPTPGIIDLAEMEARIAGYNFAVRALEIDLRERPAGDVDAIEAAVSAMTGLAKRRRDASLFYHALTPQQRERVPRFDAPDMLVQLLQDRIAAARAAAISPEFSGSEPERDALLERLNRNARRLARATALASAP